MRRADVDFFDGVDRECDGLTAERFDLADVVVTEFMGEVYDGDAGPASSIDIGIDGGVHISYYDATNGLLRYAESLGATTEATDATHLVEKMRDTKPEHQREKFPDASYRRCQCERTHPSRPI